ncbi:glycosyltransferase [Chitinophaga sp. 212800010-3]|uniref:glycosyltransferase n=1 Tax=unclassified Chitinophaga TaxID=2619133 RepID=UPI002DE47D3B|nr:Glycosyltransferase involved in cell wall biosynthesis [Chitinophaga sp. 212800010-3]
MKRILYTFPLNPIEKFSGSQTRAITLLHYFRERGMKVDFFSLQDIWTKTTPEGIAAFEQSGLVENAWFIPRKPTKKNPIAYFIGYKLRHLLFRKKMGAVKGAIPDLITLHVRERFNEILDAHSYDYIIVSYASWAYLIKDNPKIGKAVTIADTHDLLTSQHQHDRQFNLANSLEDEIRRLSLFDQVWTCSPEEQYFFHQFMNNDVRYIATMAEPPATPNTGVAKEFDLIYVGSHNPHNLTASKWFFEKVYPLLPADYKFCVIGKIASHIPQGLKNVTLIPFAEDLGEYYYKSKVALCPMLSGTGVKVKVLEAMSYGLPIVCNSHGQDGLPDKSDNGCLVTENPVEFAGFIKKLLSEPDFYQQQCTLSKASFLKNFSAPVIYKKLDAALDVHHSDVHANP